MGTKGVEGWVGGRRLGSLGDEKNLATSGRRFARESGMLQINTSVNAQALIEWLINSAFSSDMGPRFSEQEEYQ